MPGVQTYTLIQEQVIGTPSGVVSFQSIPQTYEDLVLEINMGVTTAAPAIVGRLNNDSGSNYSYTYMSGNGSTVGSSRGSNVSYFWAGMSMAGAPTSFSSVLTCTFLSYSNTSVNKTIISNAGSAAAEADASVSLWRSTAAVNRIDISAGGSFPFTTFLTGSTFRLYGIVG